MQQYHYEQQLQQLGLVDTKRFKLFPYPIYNQDYTYKELFLRDS